jgi:hypothetical protein
MGFLAGIETADLRVRPLVSPGFAGFMCRPIGANARESAGPKPRTKARLEWDPVNDRR